MANVRFGSKADIALGPRHVRFTPQSGHQKTTLRYVCRSSSKLGDVRRNPTRLSAHLALPDKRES
jgi:hypothetical protein